MTSRAEAPALEAPTVVQVAHPPAWHRTSAVDVALAVGLVLAAVGVLTSRVDLVLLALPLLAAATLALDDRPPASAPCTLRIEVERRATGPNTSDFGYRVTLDAPPPTALVHLRVAPPGAPVVELMLGPHHRPPVIGRLPVTHSGRQSVVEVAYRLVGADGGWLSLPTPPVVAERVVQPAAHTIAAMPLPHRLTGINGAHASARPGDGGEFRDLHPYAAGDRLRRIDWKATARRSQGLGDLYVRRTDATADATIVLVLDSRDDIGERVAHWCSDDFGGAGLSSMDLAREAAASLAAAAIGVGDRVSLIDLAAYGSVVRAGSGKRHLDRLLRRISASGAATLRLSRRRAPVVPAGSIVYLLSTLLDHDAHEVALRWRAAGHRVIVVDVLPAPLLEGSTPPGRVAHRLLMANRRRYLATLRANGVELVRWQEHANQPPRIAALRTLARAGQRRP